MRHGPQAWETPLSFCPCLLTSWEPPLQAPQVDGKGKGDTQLAEGEVPTAQCRGGGGREGGRAEWGLRRGAGPPPDVRKQWAITSVTDAAEVAGPLAVLLQVVCHVRRPQVLPAYLAGHLVFMTGQVGAQAVSGGERSIAGLRAERRTG